MGDDMRRSDLKHIRVGDEVFLKTQILKKMSDEILVLTDTMVGLYASGHDVDEVSRVKSMVKERAEIILQLTEA